jgi:hypothetical protein
MTRTWVANVLAYSIIESLSERGNVPWWRASKHRRETLRLSFHGQHTGYVPSRPPRNLGVFPSSSMRLANAGETH